jgi:hypothetical protein
LCVSAFLFDEKLGTQGRNVNRNVLAFAIGIVVALAIGWVVFPRVLYSHQQQPVDFMHKTHAEKSGGADCESCHAFNSDGTFAGIPQNETCAACHADKLGASPAEAKLVDDYIKTRTPTPWLVYSRQPANVWFSHAIHVKRAGLGCADCHGALGASDDERLFEQDRISGYSHDIWGRSLSRLRRAPDDGRTMSDCEDCHRKRHVEVGCLGCHR